MNKSFCNHNNNNSNNNNNNNNINNNKIVNDGIISCTICNCSLAYETPIVISELNKMNKDKFLEYYKKNEGSVCNSCFNEFLKYKIRENRKGVEVFGDTPFFKGSNDDQSFFDFSNNNNNVTNIKSEINNQQTTTTTTTTNGKMFKVDELNNTLINHGNGNGNNIGGINNGNNGNGNTDDGKSKLINICLDYLKTLKTVDLHALLIQTNSSRKGSKPKLIERLIRHMFAYSRNVAVVPLNTPAMSERDMQKVLKRYGAPFRGSRSELIPRLLVYHLLFNDRFHADGTPIAKTNNNSDNASSSSSAASSPSTTLLSSNSTVVTPTSSSTTPRNGATPRTPTPLQLSPNPNFVLHASPSNGNSNCYFVPQPPHLDILNNTSVNNNQQQHHQFIQNNNYNYSNNNNYHQIVKAPTAPTSPTSPTLSGQRDSSPILVPTNDVNQFYVEGQNDNFQISNYSNNNSVNYYNHNHNNNHINNKIYTTTNNIINPQQQYHHQPQQLLHNNYNFMFTIPTTTTTTTTTSTTSQQQQCDDNNNIDRFYQPHLPIQSPQLEQITSPYCNNNSFDSNLHLQSTPINTNYYVNNHNNISNNNNQFNNNFHFYH